MLVLNREILLICAAVLLLRLPFLNQAVQGDDPYYLKGAEHALIDPLHPNHARYVFQGDLVDMRGHPHPPLNSWVLAALLALTGGMSEPVFHGVYIVFSLLAALSAYAIARRFTDKGLAVSLLFITTPAFVINGTSFEADLPFAAFWLAAIALFLHERYLPAALAAAAAALTAYQAIVLAPILALWLWRRPEARRILPWAAVLAAPIAVAAYQVFERVSGGALPAQVLAGYMSTYGLQALAKKVNNAVALTGHLAWLVFPALSLAGFRKEWIPGIVAAAAAAFYDPNPLFWVSIGAGVMVLAGCAREWRQFQAQWILLFFAAALVLFFAGSARYLLPIAVPVAVIAALRLSSRALYAGAAASGILSLALAVVNYQHWDAYRHIREDAPRVFTNAEWGLRYYLESRGARALAKGQAFWPGDGLIWSAYEPAPENGARTLVALHEIQSPIPLRIAALGTRSNYSGHFSGLRPFDISTAPLDRVRVEVVTVRKPEFSILTIGTPQAAAQIVSGIYNSDRWTGGRATVVLKRPPGATVIDATFYIAPESAVRTVQLFAGARLLASKTYDSPGVKSISAPAPPTGDEAITLAVDKTFSVPGDQRELGVLLTEIGYR